MGTVGGQLLDVAGKILGKVLLVRLLAHLNDHILPDSQCGIRADPTTVDMIFICHQLIEKSTEQRQHFSTAFIDLIKAFDTINSDMLFTILARRGCPPTFVQMIKQFNQDTLDRVISNGECSEYFPVKVDVKQGYVLAPILFNISQIAVTHNYSQLATPDHTRTKTQATVIHELQYANDAAAIATSLNTFKNNS